MKTKDWKPIDWTANVKGSVILSVLQRYKVPISYGLSGQGKNFNNKQRLIILKVF